jgi:hypothetical protein
MVRGKFQLIKSAEVHWNPTARELTFSANYDTSIPEDQRYAKTTPSGEIKMLVDNPSALEHFKVGEFYYVDFTKIEVVPSA